MKKPITTEKTKEKNPATKGKLAKGIVGIPRKIGRGIKALVNKILGITGRPGRFLKSAFQELNHVTWLSRRDTVKFSLLILLFMTLAAVGIAALDLLFFKGLKFLIS